MFYNCCTVVIFKFNNLLVENVVATATVKLYFLLGAVTHFTVGTCIRCTNNIHDCQAEFIHQSLSRSFKYTTVAYLMARLSRVTFAKLICGGMSEHVKIS